LKSIGPIDHKTKMFPERKSEDLADENILKESEKLQKLISQ